MLMSKLEPNDVQMREFIGRKLYWRRKQLGLTQTKVAKRINVTFQQVQKFEKGTNGLADIRIRSLAAALKIPESKIGFLIWKYNKKTKEIFLLQWLTALGLDLDLPDGRHLWLELLFLRRSSLCMVLVFGL